MRNITLAQPLANNILHLQFDDGVTYDVDITPFIKTGMSNALNEPDFFNEVRLEDGFITWPNGYDFCPEFLYEYAKMHHQ